MYACLIVGKHSFYLQKNRYNNVLLFNFLSYSKLTSEKREGVITNGQSRETGNMGYTRHRTKASKA